MTNLPVPQPANATPGQVLTGAFWNANVTSSIGFLIGVPIFQGYVSASSGTSIPSNGASFTYIALDTVAIDNYGGWNSSVNTRYTAQVAGYYLCMGLVVYPNSTAGTYRAANLRKNGSTYLFGSQGSMPPGALDSVSAGVSLVYMNVGDYVELGGSQDSGSALAIKGGTGSNVTSMQCIWIHA